ncbi:hypothetical protein [Aureispira anguillae]|uniref:Uncharacterized protein n=1 Tax=Aureispira anguillae TaxID=2864201 RepID=A0A915YF16_9BACT|nr:hypothetical protein [Aureispira anguillae]BDS11806.1 hypothetical protein AsAng_0025200 [Aureispira anguillae]
MNYKIFTYCAFVFLWISNLTFGQSDEPCTASALSVSTTCSFNTFTTAGATGTLGAPAPGCANYVSGDVWFTATVPASGHLIVDCNAGVITDGGMAIYTGSCNALTLVECNDDGSANGLMPLIDNTTLTPGATVWIRFWEYGDDNPGTFDICVYDGNPSVSGPCAGGAGGNDCSQMQAICTDNTYCYTAGIGSTASTGNNYGCLLTQPNPSWYFFEISTAGNLIFDMAAGSDIDFAVWGPYANTAAATAACGALPAPIDCSFSTAPTEQVNLTGVNVGEIYVLVVTNYANVVQDITLNAATGNTAATNCAIVNPTACAADAGSW